MVTLPVRRLMLAGAVIAIVVVRLAALAAFPAQFRFEKTGIIHTSSGQDIYATNLIETGTYGARPGVPDAGLPPLYNLALAAVYRIAGRGSLQVTLLNTAFDVAAAIAIFVLGRRLFGDERVGFVAALLTGFSPYLVFQTLTISDTSMITALMFALLVAVAAARDAADRRGRTAGALCAGALFGMSMLARPATLLVGVGAVAWLLVTAGLRRGFGRAAIVLAVAAAVLVPWTVRNVRAVGAPIVFSTNGGSNLWQGNNAETTPYLRAGYDVQWIPGPALKAADRVGPEADAEMRELALTYLRSHRTQIPELLWVKFRALWSIDVMPWRNPVDTDAPGATALDAASGVPLYSQTLFDRAGRLAHRVYWGSLLCFGIAGMAGARRWRDSSLLIVPLVAVTLAYVATHPSTRYRAPADPAVFCFAAAALVGLVAADSRELADSPCCWFGSGRYDRPLDPSSERKWTSLAALGAPIFVIGFAGRRRGRAVDPVWMFRLPVSSRAMLRYATTAIVGGSVLFWLGLRRDIRIVVAQSPYEGAIAGMVTLLLRACGKRVSLIVETHGDFERFVFMHHRLRSPQLYARVMRVAVRVAFARATAGRAVSNATRDQMAAHAPQLPIRAFPAWIDPALFINRPRAQPPSGCAQLLFAGALVEGKGFDVLLRALATSSMRTNGIRLVVAGAATDRQRERATALIRDLDLEPRVALAGWLTRDELIDEMDRSRLVVVPSLSEALSRVALESMLRGTPVVGSRIPGLNEVVREEETGWLAAPGDPEALARTLVAAWSSDDIDARGARGRVFARSVVSPERYVNAHRELFELVLAAR